MSRRESMVVWMLMVLLILLPAGVRAETPAEALLGPLLGTFTTPQLRCDWIAGHAIDADRALSLYRQEIERFEFRIGNALLTTSNSGALISATIVHRPDGPIAFALELDTRPLGRSVVHVHGVPLEVGFVDRAGAVHPLFCGPVNAVRTDASTGRLSIGAVQPGAGSALRHSRTFVDVKRLDVIIVLAREAGLAVDIEDTVSRRVEPRIEQDNESNWGFMRTLAQQERMELTISSSGALQLRQSSFAPPKSDSISRKFTQMTWIEMIGTVAGELGRTSDVEESEKFPRISAWQSESNLDFAHRLATVHQRSVYLVPGALRVRNDGFWRAAPARRETALAAPTKPAIAPTTDFVATISASSPASSYSRQTNAQSGSVSVALNTGTKGGSPATLPPLIVFPRDSATLVPSFRDALERVRALAANDARETFLADLAEIYTPSLLFIWNYDQTSRDALARIGRSPVVEPGVQ